MLPSQTQVQHISRFVEQWLSKLKVGVIGGYHGGNLGDMALGKSVLIHLEEKHIKAGLQTIHNLSKWKPTEYGIVGGGAVGYTNPLSNVADRFQNRLEKVALLGVDFNQEEYNAKCINLIQNVAYVSCRSEAQAERLKKLTGRNDISFHPDIAFSLLSDECLRTRENLSKKQKKLLINIVPLYGILDNGALKPAVQYIPERPLLYENFNVMHESYKQVIRSQISQALEQGYTVETIPFTPQDEEFGKMILGGLDVKHAAYHSNPLKMLQSMKQADWVLATRYHATIFALKVGAKISPIAYAKKNEFLLQELGIEKNAFLTTDDLANGKVDEMPPVEVASDEIARWELKANNAIRASISSLKLN